MTWADIASSTLIPFLAAFFTGLGTYLITQLIRYRDLIGGRSRALLGMWNGTITPDVGVGKGIDVPLTLHFHGIGKRIRGLAHYNFPEGTHTKLEFNGGFLKDRFVRFDYINPDDRKVQFGYFVGELSSNGDKLTGFYAGYGALSDGLVRGDVNLTRSG